MFFGAKTDPATTLLTKSMVVTEVGVGEDSAAMLPFSPAGTIDLTRVKAPVHVLTGTSDRVVEHQRQGKALARLLPDARLSEIERGGHMLHHGHPELLLDAVRGLAATA